MDPFIIYEILDHSSESSTHISLVPFPLMEVTVFLFVPKAFDSGFGIIPFFASCYLVYQAQRRA